MDAASKTLIGISLQQPEEARFLIAVSTHTWQRPVT